jgi:hypothetical protein
MLSKIIPVMTLGKDTLQAKKEIPNAVVMI